MTPYSLAFVGLRLMSVWLFVQQIRVIPNVYANWSQTSLFMGLKPSLADLFLALFTPVSIFIVAVVLWVGAATIARRLCEIDDFPKSYEERDSREWLCVGWVFVGVWFFIPAMSGVLSAAFAALNKNSPLFANLTNEANMLRAIGDAFQLVLSALLVLKSYSVLRVLESARRGFRNDVETKS